MILSLCSTKVSSKSLLFKLQEYFDYTDVKYYVVERLSKVK